MSGTLFEAALYFEKVFRESKEYQNLQRLYQALNQDPQAKQLYHQINQLHTQLHQKQMMGQEIQQQEIAALQKMETAAQQNQTFKRLMEADHQVNMLMVELNRIISKPLEELYGHLGEK
ncbi:YlbF family regulator [Mesobacillus maritimus]|uniref:YlbF family regulator n=1 Tax=Mesobacillus maritimus TaxID=1643336 RepID=A0ABS7KAW1_9BACI|nr:YlbF family regulator [Mesobacillus maritimus]MBY0099389.1 YlbF family regulator [Mesobacillus maritimus]